MLSHNALNRTLGRCSSRPTRLGPACKRQARFVPSAMYEETAYGNQAPSPGKPGRAYAKFSIYKGKGAAQMSIINPTWKDATNGVYVEREGVVFWEFASVLQTSQPQMGYGNRSYAWDKKLTFAMKPAELGNFLDQSALSKGFDLFHDPNMKSETQGMVRKTLGVKLNPDGSYMMSMSQTDKGVSSFIVVPVTVAEMAIIKNIMQYAVPSLLGFDMACDSHILPPTA